MQKVSDLELEPGVTFPSFPTTDEVPVLKIVDYMGLGATGLVYKAELLHPDNYDGAPSYAVKLVNSEWRSAKEDRNFVQDLHDEYINYRLLELGKRYPDLERTIERSTATCYGLYRLRGSPPKFALITEFCGEHVKSWPELRNNDKCVNYMSHGACRYRDVDGMYRYAVLESLMCLHSLGLNHNDPDERNVVFDKKTKTYKFIDLCTCSWHLCPGILMCRELKITCIKFRIFETEVALDYQEQFTRQNELKFLNTRSFLERREEVDVEKLATSVRQLAKELASKT